MRRHTNVLIDCRPRRVLLTIPVSAGLAGFYGDAAPADSVPLVLAQPITVAAGVDLSPVPGRCPVAADRISRRRQIRVAICGSSRIATGPALYTA